MRFRKLHAAGALIMIAWFASLGWLVQREYFADSAPGDVVASALVSPGAVFFTVSLNGVQVGVASTTVDTLLGTVRISERLDVGIPSGGDTLDTRFTSDVQLSSSLAVRSFTSSVAGDLPTLQVRGLLGVGDTLALELDREGARGTTARAPLAGATFASVIPLQIAVSGRPSVGQRFRATLIDPLDGSRRDRELVVADSAQTLVVDSARLDSATRTWVPANMLEITMWRLDELGGEVPRRTWIDAQGYVVEAETEYGFTVRRTAFEIAQLNLRDGRPARAQDMLLAPQGGPGRGAPVQASDTLPEVMIPSAAPAMKAAASATIANAAGDEAAARALLRGVAGSRGGGSQERARAFVTLARAAGFPARMVGGARRVANRWTPHAWAEVHLEGAWVSVDPARGEWPADSTLVRLRTGGAMHPLQLMPLVFRLPPPSARTP